MEARLEKDSGSLVERNEILTYFICYPCNIIHTWYNDYKKERIFSFAMDFQSE